MYLLEFIFFRFALLNLMQPKKATLPEDIPLLSCALSLEHNLATHRTTYSSHNKDFITPNKPTKELFSSFQLHVSPKDTIHWFVCECLLVKELQRQRWILKIYLFIYKAHLHSENDIRLTKFCSWGSFMHHPQQRCNHWTCGKPRQSTTVRKEKLRG